MIDWRSLRLAGQAGRIPNPPYAMEQTEEVER